MEGYFFSGAGSYTRDSFTTTVLNDGGTTSVNGTATITQNKAGKCLPCPDECYERGYNDCRGAAHDG